MYTMMSTALHLLGHMQVKSYVHLYCQLKRSRGVTCTYAHSQTHTLAAHIIHSSTVQHMHDSIAII